MTWARTAGLVLAAGAAMSGCSDRFSSADEPTSAPPAASPTTASPSSSTPSATPPRKTPAAGTSGMTIRYLDSDGKIKTVRVEDFPR